MNACFKIHSFLARPRTPARACTSYSINRINMYKHDHSQFSRPTECNNKICTSRASVIAMTTNLLPSLCMSLQGLAKVERLTSRRTSLVYSLLNWRPQMVNPNLPLCQLHLVKASHLETVHNWMSSLGILGHDCAVKRDIN